MERMRELSCALVMMDWTAHICSMQPLTPPRKPFCKEVSIIELDNTKSSNLMAMILWKSFATTEVRAIGLNFAGLDGSPFLARRAYEWASLSTLVVILSFIHSFIHSFILFQLF